VAVTSQLIIACEVASVTTLIDSCLGYWSTKSTVFVWALLLIAHNVSVVYEFHFCTPTMRTKIYTIYTIWHFFYLVCDDGYYGNCTSKCHCRNGIVCEKPTGICPDNQCDQGWMGSTCSNGNTSSSFLQFFYKLVVR
jgi:hypothetical protein